MIARIWRASATREGADRYERHFTASVLPSLRDVDGHRGAYLLRRDADGRVDIQVMTLWESMDAIRRFAGDDPATAVVEPAARAVLLGYDTTVTHHTVSVSDGDLQ
ncbi:MULTISPECIES: antibiotic biosynthesis monooxygenase [unclassified Microbispora]|uniref:antibiotic biosynthesis monooxygenase family protein n=1 Tax=unclassified Microbispora TaxID=2614687 RepID=UPI001472E023|nr:MULTISPECIES: antibiotic biosynthesis monooxygenase [unclassified Microbispora]